MGSRGLKIAGSEKRAAPKFQALVTEVRETATKKDPGAGSGNDPGAGVGTGFSGIAVGETEIIVGGRIGGRLGGWSWLTGCSS